MIENEIEKRNQFREQSVPILSQIEVQEIETANKSVVSPCFILSFPTPIRFIPPLSASPSIPLRPNKIGYRRCLKCNEEFYSKGAGNWICKDCRRINAALGSTPFSGLSRKHSLRYIRVTFVKMFGTRYTHLINLLTISLRHWVRGAFDF